MVAGDLFESKLEPKQQYTNDFLLLSRRYEFLYFNRLIVYERALTMKKILLLCDKFSTGTLLARGLISSGHRFIGSYPNC